jgi:hypothetical protein
MRHDQLLSLKKHPPRGHRPWRPGCAVLPSGLVLETSFLRSTADPLLFKEMFGKADVDSFTQRLIREGYATLAEYTEIVIKKAINIK